jgi:hypothetical protein
MSSENTFSIVRICKAAQKKHQDSSYVLKVLYENSPLEL